MSGVCFVTAAVNDEPLKWGWEPDRIAVPTVVFCSEPVAEAFRQRGVSSAVRVVETPLSEPLTARDKLALLCAAGRSVQHAADHYYWVDVGLIYQHLSFEFLYSDLLLRWLTLAGPRAAYFTMPGYAASSFFGGPQRTLEETYARIDQVLPSLFEVAVSSDAPPVFAQASGRYPAADLNLNLASVIEAPILHIVGDSHVLHCFTVNRAIGCRTHVLVHTAEVSATPVSYAYQFTHHLGGRTMHHAGQPGALLGAAQGCGLKDGDAVVWVFGEIDVRSHVLRQHREAQRPLDEVIDTLARNFIRSILEVDRAYRGVRNVVFAPIPPLDNPHYASHDLPVHGSIDERIAVTRQLRAALRTLCARHDLLYLEAGEHFETERGDLQWDLSDHFCHIGNANQGPILEGLYGLLADAPSGATPTA